MPTLFTFALGLMLINFLVIPILSSSILTQNQDTDPETNEKPIAIKLKIDGTTCESCASIIQEKLLDMKGVIRADINYKDRSGIVIFDPDLITADQILEGIKPYRSAVMSEWEVEK